MIDKNKLDYISSYISKLLRKKFGKGPQSCQTNLNGKYLVTYLRGFVSPMEDILLEQRQKKTVNDARTLIMDHLLEEIKGVVQVSINVEVTEYYHDWNFPNNSGIIIFILEEGISEEAPEPSVDKVGLEEEIARISMLVQKVPDQIYIYPISPTVFLVERVGILVQIEKALISKGFQQELKFTKDELEKEYFHRDGRFEVLFQKSVKDIFIDWNFKDDKSMMAFILDK
ncbi:Na-translocating system protein MpsC family protein [Mesobacillus maritimus]|uniref:Na-translocating system protein MpsC family protein n=1 Tax=Mesobacillus maritimus TaxID=1643336 RepID=UPI00384B49D0